MSQFTDASCDLVFKIVAGKCPRSQVRAELKKIEQEFPEEQFGTYHPKRKEKPWDMNYLKELEELFYHGADSKEFIEYMAEVSDEIYCAKRIKKGILCALLAAACIAVIVIFAKSLGR